MVADFVNVEVGQCIISNEIYYRNIQRLGSGGNAVTYLCSPTNGPYQGNLFAIKFFYKLSREDRRNSFLQEIAFLRDCEHPSIMRVFDSGVFYDRPFVVAEYLPNTLATVIKKNPPLVDKVNYIVQLLSALTYLSNRTPAVIHRDIKPQNIFVKGSSCVLGDFGMMKLLDDSQEEIDEDYFRTGMPFYYPTPDLVKYLNTGEALTAKTDVYQLGLVVAELFTGRNPCKKRNSISETVELEDISRIPGKFGSEIYGQINVMLKERPEERQSASRLLGFWQSLFFNITKDIYEIEGKVF
jgi:serine/threonine-protein kinase